LLKELVARFLIGGVVVSLFAALGSALKPKNFAGLFGAAPSVALATLGPAVAVQGRSYAALEARSMMAGAVAFFIYASCTSWLMMRYKSPALLVTSALALVWLAVALGLWFAVLR
jgi:uncharacterized membrane protein (GlpM family)